MGHHFNSYGVSGGFAAICAFISWFLVQQRPCKSTASSIFGESSYSFENLQILHYIAIVIGIVLFVLSFFDFAGILYEIKLLFIAASLGLFAAACMMFYATFMAFKLACTGAVVGIRVGNADNVFEAHDEAGIAIVVLDALSALLLLGAAISFSRF